MVDLRLSEEQEMLRELAHEFANESIRPRAEHWDENSEFPMDTIAEAHEMGLLNLHIPEEYGGMGMNVYRGSSQEEWRGEILVRNCCYLMD